MLDLYLGFDHVLLLALTCELPVFVALYLGLLLDYSEQSAMFYKFLMLRKHAFWTENPV